MCSSVFLAVFAVPFASLRETLLCLRLPVQRQAQRQRGQPHQAGTQQRQRSRLRSVRRIGAAEYQRRTDRNSVVVVKTGVLVL
jgi:hypothetical protein